MREARFPTEDDVVLAVRAHLEANGWTILSQALAHQRGDDLIAERNGVRIEVEAKGAGSSKPSSKRYGQEFDASQVNDHVGRAILRALKVVSAGKARAGVALPDNAAHQRELDAIKQALDQLGVGVFLVSENGEVTSSPVWTSAA